MEVSGPIIVCDNLRSCANVGTLLRTAAFFGWHQFVFVGTSPHPRLEDDQRLPHQRRQQTNQIAKVALGAEKTVSATYKPTPASCLASWGPDLANLICLEQVEGARSLAEFQPDWLRSDQPVYVVVGNEVRGVSEAFLGAGQAWQIQASGSKRSLNVAVAGAIGLYQLAQAGHFA